MAAGVAAYGAVSANARANEAAAQQKRALKQRQKEFDAEQSLFAEAGIQAQRDANNLRIQQFASEGQGQSSGVQPWLIVAGLVLVVFLLLKR